MRPLTPTRLYRGREGTGVAGDNHSHRHETRGVRGDGPDDEGEDTHDATHACTQGRRKSTGRTQPQRSREQESEFFLDFTSTPLTRSLSSDLGPQEKGKRGLTVTDLGEPNPLTPTSPGRDQ